jgi:hypothetical protein
MREPCACGCGGFPRKARSIYIKNHDKKLSTPAYIVDSETGCHLWQRGLTSAGYGWMTVDGKNVLAHRYYYELQKGPIPDGLELDHVRDRGCLHRRCINVDHLEPVTHAENGRRAPNTKLNWEQVEQIRSLIGTLTHRKIADLFGVSHQTIAGIATNRVWRLAA